MKQTRYWVKLDTKGKPVLGVLEARPKRPIGGEWMEINARPCCTVSTEIGSDGGDTDIILTIFCGEEKLLTYREAGSTDASALVDGFNTAYPAAGVLSEDGTNVTLKSAICPQLSITVTYDS